MCRLLVYIVFNIIFSVYKVSANSGSLELDELNFDKIVNKFEAALVKFDVAYPYGEKHDTYVALAKETKDIDNFLLAEVGTKDYGDINNLELAKRYNIKKDDYPVVMLFLKRENEPVTFDNNKGFTREELMKFVRENSGLYLSLPGCVKELDLLTLKFMKSQGEERENLLKEAKNTQQNLAEEISTSGKIYITIMEKILEKGDSFVTSEYNRIKKILNGKISDQKKNELEKRLNILQTFQLNERRRNNSKEDL